MPLEGQEDLVHTLRNEGVRATISNNHVYPKPETGVAIFMLHGCKGLEFKTVFIVNDANIGK